MSSFSLTIAQTLSQKGNVHTVVKNNPILIHVTPTPPLTSVTCTLVYDQSHRDVSMLKSHPMEHSVHTSSYGPTIEARIFALSSQCEGSYFNVCVDIQGVGKLYTPPLRVISKADTRGTKRKAADAAAAAAAALSSQHPTPVSTPAISDITPPSTPSSSSPTKMTRILRRMEREQARQKAVLDVLLQQNQYLMALYMAQKGAPTPAPFVFTAVSSPDLSSQEESSDELPPSKHSRSWEHNSISDGYLTSSSSSLSSLNTSNTVNLSYLESSTSTPVTSPFMEGDVYINNDNEIFAHLLHDAPSFEDFTSSF